MTPGAGPFFAQGHSLNKLGRSPLGVATYQIVRLQALWFQRFFHVFPYISQCKTGDPRVGPIFIPGGII